MTSITRGAISSPGILSGSLALLGDATHMLADVAGLGLALVAVDVLLEATPRHVDLAEVRAHITAVPHVLNVHDLHASTVTSGLPVLCAHVLVEPGCFRDSHAPELLDALQECLAGDFDVVRSTFQLEPAGHVEHECSTHA